jgi:hypothetical protein
VKKEVEEKEEEKKKEEGEENSSRDVTAKYNSLSMTGSSRYKKTKL